MDKSQTVDIYFILFMGTAGMLMLAFAAIFLFVVYYKRNIRAKEEMHEMETHHQQRLIFSNLQTLEDERKRFAEDLHDEVGASLSAIRLHASRIETESKEEDTRTRLKDVKEIIDQAMASTRRISHNMLPPGLELFGLAKITADLAIQISKANTIEVKVAPSSKSIPRLDYKTELMLYRVLQELINNTLKHAEASLIQINFSSDAKQYYIYYADNGKGFDTTSVRYNGLGLRNLESRIKMVNGTYSFSTAPGKGLEVNMSIPLQA
jgi:signal transduction histidine kinase